MRLLRDLRETDDVVSKLLDNTRCEWTWDVTKKGYTIKGLATGKSIFLPAAGYRYGSDLGGAGAYGRYWSSSVDEPDPGYAFDFGFFSRGSDLYYDCRYYGLSVRAVTEY